METMARRGTPEDERIHKLGVAKIINQSLGGIVIAPWEVDDLPQDWVDFFLGINNDFPAIQARQARIAQGFRAFEENHPQYGKRQ